MMPKKPQGRQLKPKRRKRCRRRRLKNRIVIIAAAFLCVPALRSYLAEQIGERIGSLSGHGVLTSQTGDTLKEEGYPESLAELYDRNTEARPFVLDYKQKKHLHPQIDVSKEAADGGIPLFIQWDERWGYEQYGDDFLAVTGCGPSCLSMVYVGLTGDTGLHPLAMAQLAEKEGYYVSGSGSSWSMMTELAEKIGLDVTEVVFDKAHILAALRDGEPIICIMGPGDFTTAGHFIVLTGIAPNGEIEIRDPNSRINSERTWELTVLMKQMKNLWGYYVAVRNPT